MYTIERLIKKTRFNQINWTLCIIATLEMVMYNRIVQDFSDNIDVRNGLTGIFGIFICAILALMIINARRINDLMDGQFIIYRDYDVDTKKNFWVIEDDYFVIDVIPDNIQFDEFMKDRILN